MYGKTLFEAHLMDVHSINEKYIWTKRPAVYFARVQRKLGWPLSNGHSVEW